MIRIIVRILLKNSNTVDLGDVLEEYKQNINKELFWSYKN